MDTAEALSIARRFGQSACAELEIAGVWLYGSCAYGSPNAESDIDIAVALKQKPLDLLAAEKKLYRIRRGVDMRIEPIIIDVESDRSGFSEMVVTRGLRVYPADVMCRNRRSTVEGSVPIPADEPALGVWPLPLTLAEFQSKEKDKRRGKHSQGN